MIYCRPDALKTESFQFVLNEHNGKILDQQAQIFRKRGYFDIELRTFEEQFKPALVELSKDKSLITENIQVSKQPPVKNI